jgi:hypothetical protein
MSSTASGAHPASGSAFSSALGPCVTMSPLQQGTCR